VEIPIPKSWFGTDFSAVVYRGKVVDILVLSDRTSVYGYLSHELVRVQEYVNSLAPGDESSLGEDGDNKMFLASSSRTAMAGRILVVDDEETIRKIIISMLASANFECHEAGDGLEALTLLDSGEEFDLVLADLLMPNLDGIELLERISERYPDLPVVIVTAVHDIQVALQTLRNGAYDYLPKPFEREQLLAMVRRALECRRLKRETDAYRTNLEALISFERNPATPLPPQTEYAPHYRRLRYRLDCGRSVSVEGCYISPSTLGWLEGSKEAIRDKIIEQLPERAQEQFPWGRTNGVVVKPVPDGELPVYAFMVHLVCYEPVSDPDNDLSSLVVCWLDDNISTSLPELIGNAIRSVEWNKYAVDGNI
jgi:CheY-like chemotaxis protein